MSLSPKFYLTWTAIATFARDVELQVNPKQDYTKEIPFLSSSFFHKLSFLARTKFSSLFINKFQRRGSPYAEIKHSLQVPPEHP